MRTEREREGGGLLCNMSFSLFSLGLRSLHLENIADKVDSFNGGDDVADPSPYPSKIREKKVHD